MRGGSFRACQCTRITRGMGPGQEKRCRATSFTSRMGPVAPNAAPPYNPRPLAEAAQSILLLHVTGEDRPGITASLTMILGGAGVEVLDINQTVIHRTLLLGMLVRLPPRVEST